MPEPTNEQIAKGIVDYVEGMLLYLPPGTHLQAQNITEYVFDQVLFLMEHKRDIKAIHQAINQI